MNDFILVIDRMDKEEMLKKIYEGMWWEYCDVMMNWLKKRWKYPVMIWDVLDWISKGTELPELYNLDLLHKTIILWWTNKRLPIDEQSEECIKFVFSLLDQPEWKK